MLGPVRLFFAFFSSDQNKTFELTKNPCYTKYMEEKERVIFLILSLLFDNTIKNKE